MIDVVNMYPLLKEGTLPYEVANSIVDTFEWQDFVFFPYGEHSYKANKASMHSKGLSNMDMMFSTGETAYLKVSNSLHKVYHDGRNDNDFTKSQLKDTIVNLGYLLGLEVERFKLKGWFEFSVNIEVANAQQLIQQLIRYKNREVERMLQGAKLYGKKAYYQKYRIKVYNPIQKAILEDAQLCKAMGVYDENNLIRIEIEAKTEYIRNSWNIPLSSLQDLLNDDVLTLLGKRITKLSKGLIFDNRPPNLSFTETRTWQYYTTTPSYLQAQHRKENSSTYYDNKKKFQGLQKQGLSLDLSQKIQEKWTFLQEN